MAARSIDGPDDDLLTLHEVAKYLRMEVKTLRRLIAAGQFWEPTEISPGVRVWSAEDVAVFRAYRERAPRMRKTPAAAEEPARKPAARKPAADG